MINAELVTSGVHSGIAIIFGLSVSTFLTLVIVPTYYSWIDEKSAKAAAFFRRLFRMKAKEEEAVEG